MNPPHLPRSLFILFFFLVTAAFSVGTMRAFTPVHADSIPTITLLVTLGTTIPHATRTVTPSGSGMETVISTPTATILDGPAPAPIYFTDMTGIITLAVLMVVVILVGVVWGGRIPQNSHKPKR